MSTSRWKCPHCGGLNVEISLPTWYTETVDGTLTFVDTDGEADVMWWYCNDCDTSESGEPERTPDPDVPNPAQLAALQLWIKDHPRDWKQALDAAWLRAGEGVPGYCPELQQLRNQFGPEWLDKQTRQSIARCAAD